MTTETKHTPGKWAANGRWILSAENPDAPSIAIVTMLKGKTESECIKFENDAKQTAKLIAATPDLLDALKHIADLIGVPAGDENRAISTTANEAIAKAEQGG